MVSNGLMAAPAARMWAGYPTLPEWAGRARPIAPRAWTEEIFDKIWRTSPRTLQRQPGAMTMPRHYRKLLLGTVLALLVAVNPLVPGARTSIDAENVIRYGEFAPPPPAPGPPSPGTTATGATDELKVSADGRYLTHQDGTPFFWMGDTAWGIFSRLSREDITYYLTNRRDQGFTVIQMVAIRPQWDTNSEGVNVGDLGNPNPRYFDLVDYAVNEAQRLGMYTALWPIWSKNQHDRINSGNAEAYGRFLGERYRDKPIIWVFGGDDTNQRPDVWRRMARGIAIGETGREDYSTTLMTYHPAGQESSSDSFWSDPWLDFTMVQTGHVSSQRKPYEMIEPEYARTPPKPVVDGEAMYEKHSDGWDDPDKIAGSRLVRNYMYWPVFAGAFGHTYGHWYIWPFVDRQNIHPYSWIAKLRGDWKADYLHDEVAEQVRYFRGLMESRPFQTGVPDQSVIADPGSGLARKQATRASDGAYLMVYSPNGERFTADLTKLSGNVVSAYWYDPRTGSSIRIPGVQRSAAVQFQPPSAEDWVLVVDDAARGFRPPGQ
jgi:hypothetical protein